MPAVLILGFNRPTLLRELIRSLHSVQPRQLFLALDGPRPHVPGERALVEASRAALDDIGWRCNVSLLARDVNLGCGRAVSEAITWFFDSTDEGIILEDDVRPVPEFFDYARQLLRDHRHNQAVISISGANTVPARHQSGSGTYRLSRIPQVWGWATWRDRWSGYRHDMTRWQAGWSPAERWTAMGASFPTYAMWSHNFNRVKRGSLDTWDYQLVYLAMRTRRLTTIPRVSLVDNVGFGGDATHTTRLEKSPLVFGPTPPEWALTATSADDEADAWMLRHVYGASARSIGAKMWRRATRISEA